MSRRDPFSPWTFENIMTRIFKGLGVVFVFTVVVGLIVKVGYGVLITIFVLIGLYLIGWLFDLLSSL